MTQLAFYFDQTRCIACNACAVSCKDWNGVRQGPVTYRKVSTEFGSEAFPETKVYNMSEACHHCEDPACVTSCGLQAITKRPDGVVVINRNKCEKAQSCITACPYGAIAIADDVQEQSFGEEKWKVDHPAQKCHMCYERLDAGLQPTCVAACPQRALDVNTYAVLVAKYGEIERYEDLGTKPNFYIKKRA